MINTFLLKRKIHQIPGFENNKRIIRQFIQEIKYFSFDKANPKYFLIIARGRSGTTCLLDILTCHPQILADAHYLFDDHRKLPVDFGNKQFIYSTKIARGYKLTLLPNKLEKNSYNANRVKQALIDMTKQGVKLFYLKRDNLLKRAISIELAKTKNRWNKLNSQIDKNTINQSSFEIEPARLLSRIKCCEEDVKFDLEVLEGLPYLGLSYEKDLEKEEYHQKTLDKICQVLEIDSAPVITRYAKLSPEKLSDFILNYDEIFQAISNSLYAKYLE